MIEKKKTPEVKKGNENGNPQKGTAEVKKGNEPKKPNFEDLVKENELLRKKLAVVPADLEDKIKFFQRKQELINRLAVLDSSYLKLNIHLDKLAEVSAENEFETEDYVLNIEQGYKHNRNTVFVLDNPVIIGDVITYVLKLITDKQESIKQEIEA